MCRLHPRIQPEGHTNDDSNEQGRKGEFQCRGQALQNQGNRGRVVDETVTKLALERTAEEIEVLQPEWLIQAEAFDQASPVFVGRFLSQQDIHGISDQMHPDEHDHRHRKYDDHRLKNALQEPHRHTVLPRP